MKLDTSGLQTTAPLFGPTMEAMEGFAAAPSFEIPNSSDVICKSFLILLSGVDASL